MHSNSPDAQSSQAMDSPDEPVVPVAGWRLRWRLRSRRWLPPSLVYREWRLHASLYVTAALLLAAPVGLPLTAALLSSVPNRLYFFFQASVPSVTVSSKDTAFMAVVLLVFGASVFWWDRMRGSVSFALTGPVMRRDLLRVKAVFGVATVVAVRVILWLCQATLFSAVSGSNQFTRDLMFAMLAQCAIQSALFLAALAAACTTNNLAFAVIGAALAGAIPNGISSVLTYVASPAFIRYALNQYGVPNVVYPQWMNVLVPLLHHLSLFNTSSFAAGSAAVLPFVLFLFWYAAVALFFWWLGARLLASAPAERMSDTFFYPRLWYVLLAGVSFIIATTVGVSVTHRIKGYAYLVVFALFFCASWWLLRAVARFAGVRRRG